jgi:hypothetical protein
VDLWVFCAVGVLSDESELESLLHQFPLAENSVYSLNERPILKIDAPTPVAGASQSPEARVRSLFNWRNI